MKEVFISTTGGDFRYTDENANRVFQSIDSAGAKGSEWTAFTELTDGRQVIFVMKNIVSLTII